VPWKGGLATGVLGRTALGSCGVVAADVLVDDLKGAVEEVHAAEPLKFIEPHGPGVPAVSMGGPDLVLPHHVVRMRVPSRALSATPTIARACNAEDTANGDRDPPCFPVSPDDSSRNVSTSGTTSGPYQPGVSSSAVDVETGLAAALLRAAEAGRFDVVAQLAHELEARRR
jgi:hypothetical protein